MRLLPLLTLLLASASAKPPSTPIPCPVIDTVISYPIAHARQCDKFHYCTRGFISNTFLCEDGLLFDGNTCSLPYGIECGERRLLQTPKGTGLCERRNGNYPIKDSCRQYVNCHGGFEQLVNCAPFLIFDPPTGVCKRPDHTTRAACAAKAEYAYECPIRSGHHVFPSPGDCRAFFTCSYPHYTPILGGCSYGTVFNEATQRCDDPKNVRGCEDHYKEEELPAFDDGKYKESIQGRA